MKKLFMLAAIAVMAGSASAVDHLWQGNVSDVWDVSGNWADSGFGTVLTIPTASDSVFILNPPGPTAIPTRVVNPGAVADQINMGKWTHPGRLTVETNGTLTTTGHILLGGEASTTNTLVNNGQVTVGTVLYMREHGTFENNGELAVFDVILGDSTDAISEFTNTGDITVTNWMYLSNIASNTPAILNMNGGSLDIGGLFNLSLPTGRGHLNLHGGIITTVNVALNGDAEILGSYTIDVGNGVLITDDTPTIADPLKGNLAEAFLWFESMGLITAFNGYPGAAVVVEFDPVNNKTTLSAIGGPVADYDEWAAEWGGVDLSDRLADYEGDGLDNLLEYALGGNPTNDDAAAVSPEFWVESDVAHHIYNRRISAAISELDYGLYINTDLATGSWTPIGTNYQTGVGSAADPLFDSVTNEIPVVGLDVGFVKLEVTEN